MIIGGLEQHCGECDIIEFCGNSFGYCICNQNRFENVDTEAYKKHAEEAATRVFSFCQKCSSADCEGCELEDEARDYYCKQAAEYVATQSLI